MNLADALTDIEARCDLTDLHVYAAEDTYGGFDGGAGTSPGGSLWTVEGQVLYALVRALGGSVCELGTLHGASAAHLAAAVRANRYGMAYCIDIWEGAGSLIPADLRPYCRQQFMRGQDWLAKQKNASLALIFEDADHDETMGETVRRLAQTKLIPGGLLVSHDAAHASAGAHVCEGLRRAGLDFTVYLIEPSDCGLALWQRSR